LTLGTDPTSAALISARTGAVGNDTFVARRSAARLVRELDADLASLAWLFNPLVATLSRVTGDGFSDENCIEAAFTLTFAAK
jgi:hypothetical protein